LSTQPLFVQSVPYKSGIAGSFGLACLAVEHRTRLCMVKTEGNVHGKQNGLYTGRVENNCRGCASAVSAFSDAEKGD
jgi:hypothetical protein